MYANNNFNVRKKMLDNQEIIKFLKQLYLVFNKVTKLLSVEIAHREC